MSRLPTPGSDDGNWGDILNDYLEQAHKDDGTLKDDILTDAAIAPANIDGDTGTPSLRTLGDGAQQAYPGSAGAANAATIAALEQSADTGLVTEIAQLNGSSRTGTSGSVGVLIMSLGGYVTAVPSWFSISGWDPFSLTQPGLYLMVFNVSSNYSGYARFEINGNQPNDKNFEVYTPLTLVGSSAYNTVSCYLSIFDTAHPNPESDTSHISSSIGQMHTNSLITLSAQPVFSGGGSRDVDINTISITRVQSNPITL